LRAACSISTIFLVVPLSHSSIIVLNCDVMRSMVVSKITFPAVVDMNLLMMSEQSNDPATDCFISSENLEVYFCRSSVVQSRINHPICIGAASRAICSGGRCGCPFWFDGGAVGLGGACGVPPPEAPVAKVYNSIVI
jgi:hypothetical protein